MIDFEFVNSTNINYIINNTDKSSKFNPLNRSFISEYKTKNILTKLALRNKCILIKGYNNLVGFLWVSSFKEKRCIINEIYIDDNVDEKTLPCIANLFNEHSSVSYSSIKNIKSDATVRALGLEKKRAITTMVLDRTFYKFDLEAKVSNPAIKYYKEGEDEFIRCKIQNDIFRSPTRKDLNLQDILADEAQGYYIKDAALFIKEDNIYVGYAQIIWNKGCLTIVNLGIIPLYRNQGLGEVILNEILKLSIILFPKEKNIKIEVYDDNIPAISLYRKLGFEEQGTINYWEINKKI